MRDRALGSTIRMQFVSTNPDGGGAPVAPSSAFAASDIRIYKDGSASEKTTTNGITVTSPFDSITGLHLVEIDTSNSTGDSGFWASGSVYHVRLVTAKTVATYSVSGLLIGEFSLELQTADIRKAGGTAITQSGGRMEVNSTHWGGTAVASAFVQSNLVQILGTTLTETAGQIAAAFRTFFNVSSPVATAQSVNQTGDSFARIGTNGAGLTALATAAQINSLAINTRANLQVPIEIETPDAGTQTWKIRLFLFDEEGNMEAPDSTPTVTLVNAAGTSRSSRLSTATNVSTGVYSWDYTSTAGDAEEQLVWTFTVVEGGLTRVYPADSYVVEETAYRFSSTDRATLNNAATASALATVATNASTAATQATQANTKAAAIQAKTDQLTFTTANKVDSTAVLDPASVTAVQSGLATSSALTDVASNVTSILGKLTGITYLKNWLALIMGKTADTGTRAEVNATTAGVGYNETTDSQEAIRDRGDAAWITGSGGGGTGDAEQDTLLEVQTTVNALALSLAGTSVTVTSRVSGSEITAYIGDDYKVRSGTELEITVSDTGGALHTKLAAIGTSNLYFGASLPRKDPGQITGTISSLSYASNVLTIAVEITACASGLTTGDYTYQIQSSQAQGGDFDDFVELEGTLVVKQRTVAVRG